MKSRITILLLILSFSIFLLPNIVYSLPIHKILSESTETTCEGSQCVATIYSGPQWTKDKFGTFRNITDVLNASFDGENITFTKDTGETLKLQPYILWQQNKNILRTYYASDFTSFNPNIIYSSKFENKLNSWKFSSNFTINLAPYNSSLTIGFKKVSKTDSIIVDWSDLFSQNVIVGENDTDILLNNFTSLNFNGFLDPVVLVNSTTNVGYGDTYVSTTGNNTNYGTNSNMNIGTFSAKEYRGYLLFNLTAIPNSIVNYANLSVYEDPNVGSQVNILTLYEVTDAAQISNFAEGTTTWNLQPCGSVVETLNTSCNTTTFGAMTWTDNSAQRNYSATEPVQRAVNSASKKVLFLLAEMEFGLNDLIYVVSKEHTTISKRPTLEIGYTVDTIIPTYSINQTNSTVVGTDVKFSLYATDETALHTNGQYIFGFDNCTGTFANDSAVSFTATPQWANVTKRVNSTAGCTIRYYWNFTDNAGNRNDTSVTSPFSFVTTSTTPTVYQNQSQSLSLSQSRSNVLTGINNPSQSLSLSIPNSRSGIYGISKGLSANLQSTKKNIETLFNQASKLLSVALLKFQIGIFKWNPSLQTTVSSNINKLLSSIRTLSSTFSLNALISRIGAYQQVKGATLQLSSSASEMIKITTQSFQSLSFLLSRFNILTAQKSISTQLQTASFAARISSMIKAMSNTFSLNSLTSIFGSMGRYVYNSMSLLLSVFNSMTEITTIIRSPFQQLLLQTSRYNLLDSIKFSFQQLSLNTFITKILSGMRTVSEEICLSPSPPSAISWWEMENSVSDSMGNNDGVRYNFTDGYVEGKFGYGLEFNSATEQYVDLGDAPSLGLGTNDLSISAWVKTADETENTLEIYQKNNITSGNYFEFKVQYDASYDVAMVWTANDVSIKGTQAVNDGNWHFLTFVRNSTNWVVYFDGALDITYPNANSEIEGNYTSIGVYLDNTGLGNLFNGTIDELGVYDYALTPTEVSQLYKYNGFCTGGTISSFTTQMRTLAQQFQLNIISAKIASFFKTALSNIQLQTIISRLSSIIKNISKVLQLNLISSRFGAINTFASMFFNFILSILQIIREFLMSIINPTTSNPATVSSGQNITISFNLTNTSDLPITNTSACPGPDCNVNITNVTIYNDTWSGQGVVVQ